MQRTIRTFSASLTALVLSAGLVAAQTTQNQKPASPPTPPPTPVKTPGNSLGPRIKLGGVKSKAPRPIGTVKGTLLPPPPPRTDHPRPPHTVTPTERGGAAIISRDNDNRDRGDSRGGDGHDGDRRGGDRRDGDRRGGDRDGRDGGRGHGSGSGVSIDGDYQNDRLRLGIRIGADLAGRYYGGYSYPWYSYYGTRYYGYGYPYSSYYWDDSPFGTVSPPAVPTAPVDGGMYPRAEAPPRELTTLEKADDAMREGDAQDAIDLYREYLKKSPDDATASRSLALALLADKRAKESAAVMLMAYEQQHDLAMDPISDDDVAGDAVGLRELKLRAVTHANKVKTASAYLAVVVLMQAEGRVDAALRILEKAKDAGLDAEVAAGLETALKP